jgi:hypothetical protein
LGAGKTDAQEIKVQPFFKDVSWDDVFNKRIPAPYCPTVVCASVSLNCTAIDLLPPQKGSADTSNFDEEFTKEQPTLTPVHGQLSSRDQSEFNGFSWVSSVSYISDHLGSHALVRWLLGRMYKKDELLVYICFMFSVHVTITNATTVLLGFMIVSPFIEDSGPFISSLCALEHDCQCRACLYHRLLSFVASCRPTTSMYPIIERHSRSPESCAPRLRSLGLHHLILKGAPQRSAMMLLLGSRNR